jgi:hypothetical protein
MGTKLVYAVHITCQENMTMISLVSKGGGKPRIKYMKIRQALVKEKYE